MTREEAIDFGNMWLQMNEDSKDSSTYTFFQIAIKALEQQPCDDAISRQAALDLCERFDGSVPYSVLSSHDMLPSVSTENTGHWIDTGSGQECSECGEIQYGYDSFRKYCPQCGCRMVESQESEDEE